MTPLQLLADQVYREARAHFKGGTKSGNKIYSRNQPRARRAKIDTRATNAAAFTAAWEASPNAFVFRGSGMTLLSLGNLLLNSGNTYGQCAEMCALTAALFYRRSHAPLKIAVTLQFDHALVLIGTLPHVCNSMAALARTPPDMNCWAVDVWAGISCHPAEYLAQFHNKMLWWQAQGKLVALRDTWRQPTFAYAGLRRSALSLCDPRTTRA